jgi:membrane-bound lytic murein transglycosylase D
MKFNNNSKADYPHNSRASTCFYLLFSLSVAGCAQLTPHGQSEPAANPASLVHLKESLNPESTREDLSLREHSPYHADFSRDEGNPLLALAEEWERPSNPMVPKPSAASAGLSSQDMSHDIYMDNLPELPEEGEAPEPTVSVEKDLWDRLRAGYGLTDLNAPLHPGTKPYYDWYAHNQAYLQRVTKRARPFLYHILQEIERRGMPAEIALLPIVESAFQPFAYSPGRAAGIWQFIPATGKRYGLKQNWWYDGRRDVLAATSAALEYLTQLSQRFDGDWLLALAAYNSGEGRVKRAMDKNRRRGRGQDFWSLDLPDETRGYVPKLLAISRIIADPEAAGVELHSIPDEPYLAQVDIGSQIDLALAAELAEVSIEKVYNLNPAFNRWATDPDGPHRLALPKENAQLLQQHLAQLRPEDRLKWKRHRIRSGENLGVIAQRYQTTIELLQEVNQIRGKWIRAGDSLIIPVATKSLDRYFSEDRRRLAIQNAQRRGTKIQHVVRSGDTFWDLSRHYKIGVKQLAAWNGMSPRDPLMPGQKLVIWSKDPALVATKFSAPPTSARRQKVHYRVRKGDSLARIAQRFNVTVAKLRSWNALQGQKYIQPGQKLTLYVDITRQSS